MKQIVFLILIFPLFGLSQTLQWSKSATSTGDQTGRAIYVDDSLNVYSSGGFQSTVTFTGGLTATASSSGSDQNTYVVKYDNSGNIKWLVSGTSTGDAIPARQIINTGSHIIIFGQFKQNFTVGAWTISPQTAGKNSLFALKLGYGGQVIWLRRIAYSSNDILIDNQSLCGSYIYLTGYWITDATWTGISAQSTSIGAKIQFIGKVDTSGNFRWVKSYKGSNTTTKLISIKSYFNSALYIGGFVRDSIYFPSGVVVSRASSTKEIGFVLKVDTTGTISWIRLVGSSVDVARVNDVWMDYSGNVYFCGYGSRNTNADSTGQGLYNSYNLNQRSFTSSNLNNIIIGKYNSTGTLQWVYDYGDRTNNQIAYGCTMFGRYLFVVGGYADSLVVGSDYLKNSKTGTNQDPFILKFDEYGNALKSIALVGATTAQVDRTERVYTKNNNIYVTGYFKSSSINMGGETLTGTAGKQSVMIAKYGCDCFNYNYIDKSIVKTLWSLDEKNYK